MEVMAVIMNLLGHGLRRIRRWPHSAAQTFVHRSVRLEFLLLVSLWFACRVVAGPASTEPEAGLVGYYPFDGDLLDASGFQRHAVSDPVGGAPRFLSSRKVAPSQVLSLGGSNVSITIPSLAGFGPNGYRGTTVSLWMRCPIQGYLLGCARESVPEQSSFYIRTDGKRLMVSGGVGDELGFGFPESPNAWRHVVVVFGRSTQTNEIGMVVQVWVDGRSMGVAPIRVNPLHLKTPLTLGGISGTAHGRLQGEIDSLRLFHRAFSLEEVMNLYAHDTVGLDKAPVLLVQPQAQSVEKGRDVTFRVAVHEGQPVTFHWQCDGLTLPGATTPELTLSNVLPSLDGGRYRVFVQNASGAVFSEPALLTVYPLTPPSIVLQPSPVEVAEGEPEVVFTVASAGSGALTYQWQRDGKNLPQAKSERLTLRHVRPFFDGRYRVRVSNAYGSVWSDEVTLTINTYDSDDDGLTDYEEVLLKTDSRKPDYYGDRMPPMASPESNSWETILAESQDDSRSRRSWVSFALQILLRTPRPWWLDGSSGDVRLDLGTK
jgi:Concanavalin A-like lectin/glucanases superfamily/Immunoglobulin domain